MFIEPINHWSDFRSDASTLIVIEKDRNAQRLPSKKVDDFRGHWKSKVEAQPTIDATLPRSNMTRCRSPSSSGTRLNATISAILNNEFEVLDDHIANGPIMKRDLELSTSMQFLFL
jgi:hypothetical protein